MFDADKAGEIHEKGSLFFRTQVGSAKGADDEFELDLVNGVFPMVTSKKTGKIFVLKWDDVMRIAIHRGISAED